jgi:hypothetical protein
MPTLQDMNASLEDARFFYRKLEPIIRGSEQHQDLEAVRRYFRAYLCCWKSIFHFVREILNLHQEGSWKAWCKKWEDGLSPSDRNVFNYLRNTRDHDTHQGMIIVAGEVAAGLYPIVMFQPGRESGPPTELISCCDRGLFVAERIIQEYSTV